MDQQRRIVPVDEFTERLAQIRQRFASTLCGKIDDNFAALPKLSDRGADAIAMIVTVHRKLHEICGIAPSIGFPATGKAARAAESVLREPAQTKRVLTTEEIVSLIDEFSCLRDAAQFDLQSGTA